MSRRIAGRYLLVETLGGGGTSVVHRAELAGGPDVAVKLLRPQFAADPMLRRRFLREAELVRMLEHPGIVRVLDVGDDADGPFLVLELMRGETLRRRLERAPRLAADEATSIFVQIALALQHAHGRGVIHRDVKPENVFITEGSVKLGDFGNARLVSLASVTGASLTWGTPEYVAPEAFIRGRADPRSDLYSLGVILYEMLAGRLPWSRPETLARLAGRHESMAPAPGNAGDEIVSLLAGLLAFRPSDRPASVPEVMARLSNSLEDPSPIEASCAACGAACASDVPCCLACGQEVPRAAHDPNGRWQLVIEKLDDDAAATARLLSLVDPIAAPPTRALQFLTGNRDLYSPAEIGGGIDLPAVLFAELDAPTAQSLEARFRREGLDVRAVDGNSVARAMDTIFRRLSPKRVLTLLFPVAALAWVSMRGHGLFGVAVTSLSALTIVAAAKTIDVWKEHRRGRRGVFTLRDEIASGPVAHAMLADAVGALGAIRAPEVRALLGDVATELYRLARRAEQLGAESPGASSEGDLLRRTVAAAPSLIEGLRRMAARLDDLDAALDGETEGELMQALTRLGRAAAVPGAERATLATTRMDVEATLERRHAAEQERARLSAKLCQLLGHLRVVYREAATMDTAADRDARALEAASAELDALLVAST